MNRDFWQGRKILVTGADGFVGSHFVEQLSMIGAFVVGTSLREMTDSQGVDKVMIEVVDILDFNQLLNVGQKYSIDTIFHCAALDGNIDFKIKNSARIMDENIRMVSNVLNVARDLKIKDVMVMSSAEVYSPQVKSPIVEEDDHQKFFQYSENGYVLAKIFAEVLSKLYAKQFGMRIFLPRPTNIYGPRDKFDDSSNRVIPSMIRKVLHGERVEIWGDGSQIRGFVYVKDLVHSILTMVEEGTYQTLNIATQESVSILDLAKHISKIIGKDLDLHLDLEKPGGMKERVLDASKIIEMIDFQPMTLEQGLHETIEWYRKSTKQGII